MISVFIRRDTETQAKKEDEDRNMWKMQCEDRGRDKSDASASQGKPRIANNSWELSKPWNRPPQEPSERCGPAAIFSPTSSF